jgi:hypothetical protein
MHSQAGRGDLYIAETRAVVCSFWFLRRRRSLFRRLVKSLSFASFLFVPVVRAWGWGGSGKEGKGHGSTPTSIPEREKVK